jgi:hypothetical protein
MLAALFAGAESRAAPADIALGFLQHPEPIAKHVTLLRQQDTYFLDPVGNINVVEQATGWCSSMPEACSGPASARLH